MKKVIIAFGLILLLLAGCSTNKKDNGITEQKVFTTAELQEYDGQGENPAYIAVNGVVYDVTGSGLWRNGLHSQCSGSTYAGADLTDLINSSPHGADILKRLPVIGKLDE